MHGQVLRMVPLYETRHGNVSCWIAVTKRLKNQATFMTLWSWRGSSWIEIILARLRSLLMLPPANLFGSNCFVAQQPTSVTSDFPSEWSQNSANQGLSSISLLFRRIGV